MSLDCSNYVRVTPSQVARLPQCSGSWTSGEYVCVCVCSVAEIKTMTKTTWGGKILHFHVVVRDWEKSGQKLKARSWSWDKALGRTMVIGFFVACLPCFLLSPRATYSVIPLTVSWALPHQSLLPSLSLNSLQSQGLSSCLYFPSPGITGICYHA